MRPFTFAVVLFTLLLAGCGAADQAQTPAPTPDAEAGIPQGVLAARDAVLNFMYEGAILCVPPEDATFLPYEDDSQVPEGFGIYAFEAEGCTVHVTYPLEGGEDTIYHVNLNNDEAGCCWQARVDGAGEIIDTGTTAGVAEGNPAATYCERQGYTYSILTQEDGSQCCRCTFDDASYCNAWEYFRGECQPGDNPAEEGQ